MFSILSYASSVVLHKAMPVGPSVTMLVHTEISLQLLNRLPTFCTDIHDLGRMKPTDFVSPLTFPLAPT